MARGILACMAVLVLIFGAAVPADAAGRGGGRGGGGHAVHGGGGHRSGGHWGGHHGGRGHWGGHRGHGHGGHWWGGAFFGGFALGATLAYPYAYPYPAYAYPYPAYAYPYRYYYGYPYSYPSSPYASQVVTTQPAVAYQQEQAPVQREVVYPNGKHVLYGDGVTQAWQWVWIPAATPGSGGALELSQ